MKIDNQNPLIHAAQLPPREQPRKVEGAAQPGDPESGPGALTHLRHGATDASQDIDTARVEEIRQAIREGRLEIKADRIADGLIDNVRQMLGKDET